MIHNRGYVDIKYFILDEMCMYIELYSERTGYIFQMYIPSKYEFKMEEGKNVYKIKLIDDRGDDDAENIEEAYGDSIKLDPHKNEDIEEHLELQYKKDITLKDISRQDRHQLDGTYKQLRRLRQLVQNINYKLSISYKNYLCVIRRSDDIECYLVKHHPKHDTKRLYVVTDLEVFHEKADQMETDVSKIQSELYRILEKNQSQHSQVIDSILENKDKIISVSNRIKERRQMYESYTKRLETMMQQLIKKEEFLQDEMKRLSHNSPYTNITNEMATSTAKSKIEAELFEIAELKKEISKYLNMIKDDRSNLLLKIDVDLFENTVMISKMLKNFEEIGNFL